MMKYIPELGYELEGRALAHWEGTSDLTAAQCEKYRQMLLKRPKPGTTTAKPSNGYIANVTAKFPCIHRGAATGKTGCRCHQRSTTTVYACKIHGKCSLERALNDTADGWVEFCQECEEREETPLLQLEAPRKPVIPARVLPPITYHYPHVVYHVAEMGDWQEVVCEQLYDLAAAGLVHINVTVAGGSGDWVVTEAAQRGISATIVARSPSLKVYESLALDEVYRFANSTEGIEGRPILYLHTKGVSAPGNLGKRLWRRLMMRHLVAKWREHWPALTDHDAVGCNWMPHHRSGNETAPHFAGNFWLARADYIRSLPPWEAWWRKRGHERFSCESWIGANPAAKVRSLLVEDVGWGNDAPENFTPFLETP